MEKQGKKRVGEGADVAFSFLNDAARVAAANYEPTDGKCLLDGNAEITRVSH